MRRSVKRHRDGADCPSTPEMLVVPIQKFQKLLTESEVEQRCIEALISLGEPKFDSFSYIPTPEEYEKMCDVIKVV